MKVEVYDIKIANRSFTEKSKLALHLPAEAEHERLIGWLKEYDYEPYTIEHAMKTYLLTKIFYSHISIDYKVNILIGSDKPAVGQINPIVIADMYDDKYETYSLYEFDMQIPSEVILDTDKHLMYTEYADSIDQLVYEMLMQADVFDISNIRKH